MVLALDDKKAIVADVNETASKALSLVVADARGCTVEAMTGLRKQARDANVSMRVVRNTLARLAVKGTDFECATESFSGPTLLAFSMEDPGAAARLFKDFAKENGAFEVKALSVSGQLLAKEQLDVLAKLPTRDEALAQLMSVMQAPVTKLVRTVNDVPGKLVRVMAAVRDQKQEGAAA